MSAWQRYTGDPVAQRRLAEHLCPECGALPELHGGLGLGRCSLTDTGVYGRVRQYNADLTLLHVLACHGMGADGCDAPNDPELADLWAEIQANPVQWHINDHVTQGVPSTVEDHAAVSWGA